MVARMRARAAVVLLILLGGCTWRGYGRVMEIHLEVIESMAAKMCALTAGPPPASVSMGEFVYPAKRAREVAQQFPRRRGLGSYHEFEKLVGRYEELVQTFDHSRLSDATWTAVGPQVCSESHAIAEQVEVVRKSLADED